jgi:hypothetical protein
MKNAAPVSGAASNDLTADQSAQRADLIGGCRNVDATVVLQPELREHGEQPQTVDQIE